MKDLNVKIDLNTFPNEAKPAPQDMELMVDKIVKAAKRDFMQSYNKFYADKDPSFGIESNQSFQGLKDRPKNKRKFE